jgi:hypothetical protein
MTCLEVGEHRHVNDNGFTKNDTVTQWREFVEKNVLLVAELIMATRKIICNKKLTRVENYAYI